jgi:hypothetical protein
LLGYLASLSCSLNASISQAKTPNLAARVAACGDLANQVGGQSEPNKKKKRKKQKHEASAFFLAPPAGLELASRSSINDNLY